MSTALPASLPRVGDSLRVLYRSVGWDLRLQSRYQIVTVSLVVTAAYGLVLRLLPDSWLRDATILLVLADPTMIGFLFVGALVLFERDAGITAAVAVSPSSPALYVWSKAVSLTTVSVVCAVALTVAGHGMNFRMVPLLGGVVLTSLMFVFIGIVAVVRVRSVNGYLLIVPVFLVPMYLPLLGSAGFAQSPLYYLLPTQGSLLLIARALESRPAWEALYGVTILGLWLIASCYAATRSYESHVRGRRS
ncbi:ABC transporter permease [Rhodococcus sp. BGS-1C]|jgi:fluoroquinolone transport system permease protein|uniref:fluoroquinolone export ABC transporter permease subunit n=1 Tax=unclassified Rhodococcus (in: high G+C Gram-positive bacteria) TaxID=192944 RepID=UPI0019D17354|nr:ABC transporter permease [Rhodococcus sp. KRD197]